MLLSLARWLDTQTWSTQLHESYYMYAWIESTHVLTLMLFLGMLFVIDGASGSIQAHPQADRRNYSTVLALGTGDYILVGQGGAQRVKLTTNQVESGNVGQ